MSRRQGAAPLSTTLRGASQTPDDCNCIMRIVIVYRQGRPMQTFMKPVASPVLALICVSIIATNASAASARKERHSSTSESKASYSATTIPGSIVRWSTPGTIRCAIGKKSWLPLGETCYYPFDVRHKPGVVTVTRTGANSTESARIVIEEHDYGTQEVELPDIPQRNPSASDFKRVAREQTLIARATQQKEGPPRFTLPLGTPTKPLPSGKAFGVKRIFDGKPAPNPHMGIDFAAGPGTPVLAVADGIVVIADDLFYPGNAVYVDHGDGLVSESFHLSEISVKVGDAVKQGDVLGKVGTTGRSTGPHLFFGTRWHGARVNPRLLLEDPSRFTAIK